MKAQHALQTTLALISVCTVVHANPIPIPTLLMPEEFIDVTVRRGLSGPEAAVSGRYPFQNLGHTAVTMLYPVAPGSSRIGVWMDGVPLIWQWSGKTYPTILPEWPELPMVQWDIAPVPDEFIIEAHYEHELVRRPTEWVFLYPMGTGKYLETYAKQTTAHVNIDLPDRYLPKGLFRDAAPAPFELIPDGSGWRLKAEIKSRPFEPLLEDLILKLVDRWADPQTWWSQPPDMAAGFDVFSSEEVATIVADDFVFPPAGGVWAGLAILHWWGSYPGWQPQPHPEGHVPRPDYFVIRIFEDEPAPHSPRPGPLVHEERIDRFEQEYFGVVVREAATPSGEPVYEYEHKFEYRARLAKPFRPQAPGRYWLSICAGPVACEWTWGWATSPVHWGSPAMAGTVAGSGGWLWKPASSPSGEPVDMAFTLASAPRRSMRYRLIEGSTLTEDCSICERPPIVVPIRGSFWLCPAGENLLFSDFLVNNLAFHSIGAEPTYVGRGSGQYRLGGEVALLQQMTLRTQINELDGIWFDSGPVPPQAPFPWIEIDLAQVPPADPTHVFGLHLVAVPWPVLHFSTEFGFHASSAAGFVSAGDLISTTGGVVRRNADLTRHLGVMPPVPDLGLDAVTYPGLLAWLPGVRPEALWFSLEEDVFSESLGSIGHGDLLSETGSIVRRNADLIRPFSPEPGPHDYGLDAIAVSPDGRLLFSTEESFFSEKLGVVIDDGDLLTEDGTVFRTNGQLMARFEPIDPVPLHLGLDGAYVWPNGEVWFSTEASFTDRRLGPVREGDLLSDTGRIVWRNLELLERFGPLEDLADFGLDAVQVAWPDVPADADADGDVDVDDFAHFQACFNGPGRPAAAPECGDVDSDSDNDVDVADFAVFQACFNGSDRPPAC